jgi:hypothetical protein
MTHYWMAVASREHVMRAISGGIAQVCHGKQGPLKKMKAQDFLIYYSPTEQFGQKDVCRKVDVCRKFTAIGQVKDRAPYQVRMSDDFIPWRIDVAFMPATEVAIEPLLPKLSFILDKKRWGFPFRRGLFSIPEGDFQLIASHMGVIIDD